MIKTNAMGQQQWNSTFGGSEIEYIKTMIKTADGGFLLGGDTVSYGAGDSDIWLVKVDATGNPEWNHTFGGIEAEYSESIIQAADGDYVLAGSTGSYGDVDRDMWFIKTDEMGQHEWNTTFGWWSEDGARSIIQTTDEGFAITGFKAIPHYKQKDIRLVKLNVTGHLQWNTTFGSSGEDESCSILQTGDGGFIILGITDSYGMGGNDIWLIKTDTLGRPLWNETLGGTADDNAGSIVQTTDGDFVIAGDTKSYGDGIEPDIWLLKVKLDTTSTSTSADFPIFIVLLAVGACIVFRRKKER